MKTKNNFPLPMPGLLRLNVLHEGKILLNLEMLCIAWLPEMSFLTLFLRELCLKKLGITTQSRLMLEMISCFVSNKAKSRISKRVLQKNKEPQIFRKTNISYPLIRTRTCPYQGGEKCSFFSENLVCFVFL